MEEKQNNSEEKKSKGGRKKGVDNKRTLKLYVRESIIEQNASKESDGEAETKKIMYNSIGETPPGSKK